MDSKLDVNATHATSDSLQYEDEPDNTINDAARINEETCSQEGAYAGYQATVRDVDECEAEPIIPPLDSHRTKADSFIIAPEVEAETALEGKDQLKPGPRSRIRKCFGTSSPHTSAWNPSFRRSGPVLGLSVLIMSICTIFVSLGILLGSHEKPQRLWTWQPTVYLAISTAVSNACLGYAFSQALPSAWWYQASKGAAVRSLQRRWEVGQSVFQAIAHIRSPDRLTLASLLTALVLIDGPLLQRASRVESLSHHELINMSIPISPELPRGFSGVQKLVEGGRMVRIWQDVIDVGEPWKAGRSIEAPGVACEGTCRGKVLAPAISLQDCTYKSRDMPAETMLNNASFSWSDLAVTGPNPAFFVLISGPGIHNGIHAEKSALGVGKVNLTYTHEEGDVMMHGGSFNLTRCILQSAVGEYDVEIQNASISISKPPRIIALANNTDYTYEHTETWQPNTFLGLVGGYVSGNVSANCSFKFGDQGWALDVQTKDSNTNAYQIMGGKIEQWRDPIPDTMNQINNLFFRAGVLAAQYSNTTDLIDNGLSVKQTMEALKEVTELCYVSNMRWWAGAAALQIFAILSILPVYWGYWRLGMAVTLSPFEVAKLFGAPMFDTINSTFGAKGVVEKMGGQIVRLEVRGKEDVGMVKL
ncbi:hypothetical protein HII31_09203 [Pseudocercospora fuligena]|uniref:Uncharacterized protein n=1 Tax=Pseudocercospora fuligena TaxID=685502 RepID=A0A8H6REM6_9PEZI|nr:hypothetical protein HII31_09203 [Pseudocercospora fuligena]